MVNEQFSQLFQARSITVKGGVRASHAAIATILPTVVGSLDDSPYENVIPKLTASSKRGAFVKGLLRVSLAMQHPGSYP
jgi:hypothetical protein